MNEISESASQPNEEDEEEEVRCDHCKKPVWNNVPGFCCEDCKRLAQAAQDEQRLADAAKLNAEKEGEKQQQAEERDSTITGLEQRAFLRDSTHEHERAEQQRRRKIRIEYGELRMNPILKPMVAHAIVQEPEDLIDFMLVWLRQHVQRTSRTGEHAVAIAGTCKRSDGSDVRAATSTTIEAAPAAIAPALSSSLASPAAPVAAAATSLAPVALPAAREAALAALEAPAVAPVASSECDNFDDIGGARASAQVSNGGAQDADFVVDLDGFDVLVKRIEVAALRLGISDIAVPVEAARECPSVVAAGSLPTGVSLEAFGQLVCRLERTAAVLARGHRRDAS